MDKLAKCNHAATKDVLEKLPVREYWVDLIKGRISYHCHHHHHHCHQPTCSTATPTATPATGTRFLSIQSSPARRHPRSYMTSELSPCCEQFPQVPTPSVVHACYIQVSLQAKPANINKWISVLSRKKREREGQRMCKSEWEHRGLECSSSVCWVTTVSCLYIILSVTVILPPYAVTWSAAVP